jgi:uncharacterized protein YndB with AHSA1/START domain
MPKRRELTRVGGDYLTSAPVTAKLQQSIPASADETFRCLEDPDAWPQWISGLESVRWTSPKPFGVGTTRTVENGRVVIEEEFFAWEDRRRMSFCFTATTDPVFGAFAEDYLVEPRSDDRCELTWRYAFECRPPLRFLQPVVGVAFRRVATGWLSNLAIHMANNRAAYEGVRSGLRSTFAAHQVVDR